MYLKVKKEIIDSTVFEDKWYKVIKEKEYFYIVKEKAKDYLYNYFSKQNIKVNITI